MPSVGDHEIRHTGIVNQKAQNLSFKVWSKISWREKVGRKIKLGDKLFGDTPYHQEWM